MVELGLDESIVRELENLSNDVPGEATNKTLKFDAKGTPHLMYRDEEGKLLGNVPIKEVSVKTSYEEEIRRDIEEYRESRKVSGTEKVFRLICVSVVIMVILCIKIVNSL